MKWPLVSRLWAKGPGRPLTLLTRLWALWPRRTPGSFLNLLAPDVVCEAHFHVLGNGDSKMYVSKLPPDIAPQELVYIVKCMLDNVVAFGQQHHVQVNVKQEGKS